MTTNNLPTVEQLADIVREHLTAAYVCNRVWEDWSYNTMGPDDFIEASETEMADEIAVAILERLSQPAMPADAPAYRLLGAGEIIQANDEFIANDGVTWSAAGTGIWVGMPYTHVLKTARRRIEGES